MPHDIPWTVQKQDHPGSSAQEIEDEPSWTGGHQHRVGFKNRQDRRAGLTHEDDEQDESSSATPNGSSPDDEAQFTQNARERIGKLREEERQHQLVNFRDIINSEPDFHLRYPNNRSIGWRYVLDCTEDWVKNGEEWPANVKKRQQKEQKSKSSEQQPTSNGAKSQDQSQEENEWKRSEGENSKHHDAYAVDSGYSSEDAADAQEGQEKSEYQKLLERYTPQEIALLRSLQHEKNYRKQLRNNSGKRASPQKHNRTTIAIDEADQFTPDNWLPRSDHLIRLTGKHPLNAEADLTTLFEGGLITPNELHYVRNHGAVPRILWEFHELEVETPGGELRLSMDELKHDFESVNIPISLACDGNRRKELNMIKKSKGFSWGAGATGCVYWKGPLLRDVLLAAGLTEDDYDGDAGPRFVNFQGADEPSEGKYETCIPLEYAMDPTNDVLLAYEMNDVPLPPDHGYPVRVMIPGYVGGRCVKWLEKIWISDHENESHYHIWDNQLAQNTLRNHLKKIFIQTHLLTPATPPSVSSPAAHKGTPHSPPQAGTNSP